GDYRGTTMSFSGGGFMGFYAGSSTYEIIEVSEHILTVRMEQANEPLFAWYHTFSSVKPEQK
nr:glycoside hydrolase family 16 protein [Bacteroidota bacterium]